MGYSSSQTREYCVATNATHRADRPDSSLREERWFGMTIDLSVTPICAAFGGLSAGGELRTLDGQECPSPHNQR